MPGEKFTPPRELRELLEKLERSETQTRVIQSTTASTIVQHPPKEAQVPIARSEESGSSQRIVRFLVVEDDMSIVRLIRSSVALLRVPYIFAYAHSAEEGLELWNKEPYDILLTDYNLPGMAGTDLVKTLRARGETAPVIMFTAYDSPELRREVRRIGIDRYIAKPFLIDDMLESIRMLLKLES
ncbi:MAG: response regulator [Chloroflexaceae bacterium]|nr:response regulator [Chloroflexaceae bacterium]NJL33706.1 response regulator [Chloroflexaceae bacterium]NJO06292.1 response regulator [Chloroflexaceae bacterium]